MVDPKSLGRILVPQHGLFEGCIEWANGSPLQKIQRQLLGVHYDEPMSERLLPKPLSPNAYKKETDGPTLVLGFVGFMLDDGATVVFEHNSMGAKKAVNALATTATQALVAFGEMVHPVIELGVQLVRELLSDDLRPEVQRDRLRHRQAGTGGRRHLR